MATVAEQLQQARAAAGLSIKQVADATKMRADHIHALEAGNYEPFVAPVYIRGSVRTYARLLRLEEAVVLAALDEELGRTERFREHPSLTGGDHGTLDKLTLLLSRVHWRIVLPILGVLAVLIIGLAIERRIRQRRANEPLTDLGSALYEPKTKPPVETLPLPTNSPPRR
jgi:cytoskeletal protein RodZ